MVYDYNRFYSQYKHKLYSYLMYKCGNAETAQDIMQDTFFHHFQHYADSQAASPALLFTIARNALIDIQRKQKRYVFNIRAESQVAASEESSLIAKEESARILEAMKSLSKEDRDMLTMAVNGVPYREICDVFKLSVGALKVRIHRSRKKLSQKLQEMSG